MENIGGSLYVKMGEFVAEYLLVVRVLVVVLVVVVVVVVVVGGGGVVVVVVVVFVRTSMFKILSLIESPAPPFVFVNTLRKEFSENVGGSL